MHFDLNTIHEGVFKVTYRGIPAIRSPFDYLLYQMLVFEVKPDLIIEIGTNFGGSALYLADLLLLTTPTGRIHTIDIVKKFGPEVSNHPRITTFTEGWQNYNVKWTNGFSKVVVIDDGSHRYQDVLEAWKKFHGLVSVGSYYIIEDGVVEYLNLKKFDGGPLRAIREIFPLDGWIVDRRFCDFFGKNATYNVEGYLKRIK